MTKNAGEMEYGRSKSEGAIFQCVSKALDGPIKVRRRGVSEKKMLEPFRNESPTADERITQNKRMIVPDKSVAQSRGVSCKHGENNQQNRPGFFQVAKGVEQIVGIRV